MLLQFINATARGFANAALLSRAWLGLLLCSLLLQSCSVTSDKPGAQRVTKQRPPVAISASAQNEFDKALELMQQQQYSAAIAVLEKLLEQHDQLPGAYINLAIAYMHLPPPDAAAIPKPNSESPTALQQARLNNAEQALLKAIAIKPDESIAHHQLGLLYRRMGRFAAAKTAYQRAIAIQPEYAIAHLNLGILCDIYLQAYDCAIKHFSVYQELAPDNSEQVNIWLADLQQRASVAASNVEETVQ